MNYKFWFMLLLSSLASQSAQASILINGSHISENINQREQYYINVNASGNDDIYLQSLASLTPGFDQGDTFMDGYLSVWQLVGTNWSLIAENDNAPRTGVGNTGSTTVYGQNVLGFVAAQPSSGLSDPGLTVNLSANQTYMIVQSAFNDEPIGAIGLLMPVGAALSGFFKGLEDLSGGTGEQYVFTNNYSLTVTGNVVAVSAPTVAAVPVPAAIWFFGPAVAGFSIMRRNRS